MKSYPDYVPNQAICNSLKGPARKALITLKPNASSADIINKLESVFGNIASGESVLQEFYTASQKPDESVTMWGLRIEEFLQRAIEKGHVTQEQRKKMLRTKFWRVLYSTDLQNATRVYYHEIKEFELLREKLEVKSMSYIHIKR